MLAQADIGFVALAVASLAVCLRGSGAPLERDRPDSASVCQVRFGEMVVSGVAVNNVLPGRIGDLLRARWLQVAARIPGGRSLATVFVDRAFDVFALVVFLAISLVVRLERRMAAAHGRGRARPRRRDRADPDRLAGVYAPPGAGSSSPPQLRASNRAGPDRGSRRAPGHEPNGDARGSQSCHMGHVGVAASFVARAVGVELSVVEAIFLTAVINLGLRFPRRRGSSGPTSGSVSPPSRTSTSEPSKRLPSRFSCTRSGTSRRPCVGGALLVRRGLKRSMKGLREAFRRTAGSAHDRAALAGSHVRRHRTRVRITRSPSTAVSFLPASRDRARYPIGTS